ncbi:MAG: chromosome segregation protein SMC [Gammaproteobacteria bacterium]
MRITRIKVSGFKSFVDPTTLTLPGNLTGIVGPNGCGKSNIIDALIWVMGESSAKHLRGESMTDVIFSGSNTRKPVGQAMVEIVFDNTDGTIGGQYSGFGEISVKRSISRDGVSSYFLNGARCRRKDITHVFLGTGLGARGYSVIEQGMISRVIEARPEELRAFLEEAAGISKYKERRRETENRMQHTHENLERLNDIRDELDKQLGHLQRQARAAERYQTFKADERLAQAKLLCARARQLESERDACRSLAERRTTELEAEIARLRDVESQQAGFREAQVEANDSFNRVQSEFYARAADISRLEQAIRHNEEREQALVRDRDDAQGTQNELERVMQADAENLNGIRARLADLEPRFASAHAEEAAATQTLGAVEARMQQWQIDWESYNREHNALAQQEQATRIRLEHLLAGTAEHDQRQQALRAEAERNDTRELDQRAAALRDEQRALDEEREALTAQREALRAALEQSRSATQNLGRAVHDHQVRLEEQRGRLASLAALQEAAYGDEQEVVEAWARAHGITDVQRLADAIDIEPGWEAALEAALRIPLGALCAEGVVARVLDGAHADLARTEVTVIDTCAAAADAATGSLLAAKIRGRVDLAPLLHEVHAAADEAAARHLLGELPPQAIVALPNGTLIGHNWARLPGQGAVDESILARARQISGLRADIARQEAETERLRGELDNARNRLRDEEQHERRLGELHDLNARASSEKRDELGQLEAELKRRQARAADVLAELERLARITAENERAIAATRAEQDSAATALEAHAARRESLIETRNALQAEVDRTRQHWHELRESAHAQELEIESLRAQRSALEDTGARNATAYEQLEKRRLEFDAALATLVEPRARMSDELEAALAARLQAETALSEARSALGDLDEALRQANTQRAEIEQAINECKQRLEQVRLDLRAFEVRLQEINSRFEQTGEDCAATAAALTPDDTEQSLAQQIEKLGERIARLGPINLAAIDEYNQLSERKTYLDRQYDDLTEALATLQDAIRKIDRETRTRFKETYDKVNNGLQAMFPVLFGGGHAYLEMTGDDLLETGVTVMARPPGKRNSTIHLLSGGEKALTALSFVFAIFELNPAPFCLLDEVDAPLDDTNVVRLTEMLKTMANTVQFLFVTHNKITMEIAEQLIGVTMHEPGVSRLVSVNMDQAVELAATA